MLKTSSALKLLFAPVAVIAVTATTSLAHQGDPTITTGDMWLDDELLAPSFERELIIKVDGASYNVCNFKQTEKVMKSLYDKIFQAQLRILREKTHDEIQRIYDENFPSNTESNLNADLIINKMRMITTLASHITWNQFRDATVSQADANPNNYTKIPK